jgi:phosphoenolpyruvate-protein phosphotransferase
MSATVQLVAPLAGYVLALGEVPDPVFAQGLAGDGLAIDPTGEVLFAPCDGEVALMPAGRHALTLRVAGAEVLMHVGIDTVQLADRGFELLVGDGERVVAGQPLLNLSLEVIARGARSAVTPIVLAPNTAVRITRRVTGRLVTPGDFLMELTVAAASAADRMVEDGPVRRQKFVAAFDHGLHARPAALIVAALKPQAAGVTLEAHGRSANARSTVALMSLGVRAGEVVEAVATGADAAAALAALQTLMPLAPAPRPVSMATPPVARPQIPIVPLSGPRTLPGVIAARGFAVGVAVVLAATDREVPERGAGVAAERAALQRALDGVRGALEQRQAGASGAQREILEAHLALISDPELLERAQRALLEGCSAAFGYRQASRALAAQLGALEDPRLRERAADLRDLERQVLAVLAGEDPRAGPALPQSAIVIAEEILPSQLLNLEAAKLAGLVMARGGPTSHVAILAAARGLPALVAMGEAVLSISPGTAVVLDADAGQLLVDPPAEEVAAARARLNGRLARQAQDLARAHEPALTREGVRVSVLGNLGGVNEVAAAVAAGAEGCGLLRTEFLFLDRREPPDEEEQTAVYGAVLAALSGRPLTIRTLDAGGDKPIPYLPLPHEDNPALGLRGLRTSLWRADLFQVQLRAILRASQKGPCRILLPMVTELADLTQARAALLTARRALGAGPAPPVGIMVETPASALLAAELAGAVEFLSIGTNDLSQYTLAMDRLHPALAGRLDALHPAVLRLIKMTTDAAQRSAREVAVCGALASDPFAVPVLLGLGVRELSCVPAVIPRIKALVRSVTVAECEALANAALKLTAAAAVRALARDWQAQRGLFAEVA